MLKKQEMLEILRTLEFDSEVMGRLLAIIDSVEGGTLDADTLRDIKTILLEEEEKVLDGATADMGIDVTDAPDLQTAEAEFKAEVESIKSEFENDMKELGDVMDKLEHADSELTRVSESIQTTGAPQVVSAS